MLVQCKNCNVHFDDSFGKCIACGDEIVLSSEEEFQQCVKLARVWLSKRRSTKDIFADLAFRMSLPSPQIRKAIRTAKEQRRAASRKHGLQLMGSGLLLLMASAGLYVFTLGFQVHTWFLAMGCVMFVFGMLKVLTGWNITGHDED